MRSLSLILVVFGLLLGCKKTEEKEPVVTTVAKKIPFEAISLSGDTLRASEPSEELLVRFEEKKTAYEADPLDVENIVWMGRFTAYQGKYKDAIGVYTKGMENYPNDPKLYRHRGHRYISIREFDEAIADLSYAPRLIENTENEVEPDGMPNARNIPVSTLHGNIYYHLGLAHYLNHEWKPALDAYKKCLETSSNPDNVVSATHWIYMIYRRMGQEEAAANYLRNISADMDIIENMTYHKACLMYKGEIDVEDIDLNSEDNPANSALKYAVGNWYLYNGNPEKAKEIFLDITSGDDWASFGYIAAESDLTRL